MKLVKTYLKLAFLVGIAFTSNSLAQSPNPLLKRYLDQNDPSLLPKYGGIPRTPEQQTSDEKFINSVMEQPSFEGNRTAASNHMIGLGFQYLYRNDLNTAIRRFNQAYLLDSTNAEIYYGYGSYYFYRNELDLARNMYQEELRLDPTNAHLLTDYGTTFLADYYELQTEDLALAIEKLNEGISLLEQSYQSDSTDKSTLFKLSICYWLKEDCDLSWRYYLECEAQGGEVITPEFTRDLEALCPKEE